MLAMTLADFNEQIVKPQAERFLAKRGQTEEEFLAEFDRALEPHRRVMRWACGEEASDA